MEYVRFAINILENDRNEILLLKRSLNLSLGPGQWGFPAGHIEPDETPERCSIRELREELGPHHRLVPVRRLGPVRDSFYGGKFEIFLFHYRWTRGNIELNKEHTAYAWVGREAYLNYDVVDGIDEDLDYFGIWPRSYLNKDKLPR